MWFLGDALKEIAAVFLRLGTIAFGGPAAHIAMMEEEFVIRRKWLTHEYFLDLVGATNLIPGPNSTEMAIHIGYMKAGWKGLTVAGICFIFPAVTISLVLAYLYVAFGTIPQVGSFMLGIRAGVIAIILAAVFRLSRPVARNFFMIFIGTVVCLLNLLHVDEIILLLSAGVFGIIWGMRGRLKQLPFSLFLFPILPVIFYSATSNMPGTLVLEPSVTALGLFFLKIGSILYGSGYVLIAFLQGGLVDARHWLTQTQLLDAIAVGQFTPGPVLSTATFIGYLILGLPGAAVSTAGIFLPSFIFVLITAKFVPKFRKSPLTSGFLDGVNAASLGLMVAVCIMLGSSSLVRSGSWVIFLAAGVVLLRWNLHAAWIVVGAAILGWLFSMAGIM